MKSIEWILNITLILLVTVTAMYIQKNYLNPKFKSISIVGIINEKDDAYQQLVDGKIDNEKYTLLVEEKMKLVDKGISELTSKHDVVVLKELLVKSHTSVNVVDITEDVKNYVKAHQNSIEK